MQAGGFVAEGRVNGSLNLSRAVGDHEYKQVGPALAADHLSLVCSSMYLAGASACSWAHPIERRSAAPDSDVFRPDAC